MKSRLPRASIEKPRPPSAGLNHQPVCGAWGLQVTSPATVTTPRVACDGASEISAALGHPRVYLQIDEKGFVDCGYCDKRFILKGGPADTGAVEE